MNNQITVRDIEVGQKFILKRDGRKYKKVGEDQNHSPVKPVGHLTGLLDIEGKPMKNWRSTLHNNSHAIPTQ